MWKNAKLHQRRPKGTFAQVMLPVAFVGILWLVRNMTAANKEIMCARYVDRHILPAVCMRRWHPWGWCHKSVAALKKHTFAWPCLFTIVQQLHELDVVSLYAVSVLCDSAMPLQPPPPSCRDETGQLTGENSYECEFEEFAINGEIASAYYGGCSAPEEWTVAYSPNVAEVNAVMTGSLDLPFLGSTLSDAGVTPLQHATEDAMVDALNDGDPPRCRVGIAFTAWPGVLFHMTLASISFPSQHKTVFC